jgi:hypothetical protein
MGAERGKGRLRKQDKGGPFFWSRLESLTNPWPISIRVGQSGPRLSSAPSCTELASRPTSGGPVELHRGPPRTFRNGSCAGRSTAPRRTACAAEPRQIDRHQAPSGAPFAGCSAAENDAHATPSRVRGEHVLRRWSAGATGLLAASEPPTDRAPRPPEPARAGGGFLRRNSDAPSDS